jgi:putative aldouronate transport system substrate-binding protein
MRKMKKVLTVLLLAAFLLSLTACGDKQDQTDGGKDAADITPAADTGENSADEETYTVKIVFVGDAAEEACNAVAEQATNILKDKYNVKIDLIRLSYGSFVEEVNLMLTSDEKIDLMPNFGYSVATAANNGQILKLDDLLAQYGQGIMEQVTDAEFRCVTVQDGIYAVPNNKEKAQGFGIAMRSDVLEDLGYDVSTIQSEADLEPLFQAVKDAYPDMYPLISDGGYMGYSMNTRDELGGDFGVLENCLDTSNTTIVSWHETETYKKLAQTRYDWAQKGYIMPDASTATENAGSLIGAGKGFAYFTNTKPGIEGEWSRKAGIPMTVVELVEPFKTTSGVANQWFIPHSSERPEKAMQVLNEIYTNSELSNLFVNGIEGQHYIITDEANGVIGYPEGVDASNTTYSSVAWAWPNELNTYAWETDGANIWKDTLAFNESAIDSVGMGFIWDNSGVLNEITACNNVTVKYVNAIECGSAEPDEALDRLNSELRDAGIDKIISEKQKQFDAWLASKE